MNLFDNPIIAKALLDQLPKHLDKLGPLEKGIVEFIRSHPTENGETHTVLFTEIDPEGNLYLCIGAFNKKEMVRLIAAKPFIGFIKSMLPDPKKGKVKP